MAERDKDRLGLNEEDAQHKDEGPGIAALFLDMSDGTIDAEALAASEDGQIMNDRLSVMAMPENSEISFAYWLNYEKGLLKEIHDEGLEKWATYVPAASKDEPDRKFPLIFLLHGAHNPIQMTESYGVVQLAARDECIVIAPENENWESIERKICYAREHLPVDWSRVYSIGYSFGGFMTARNTLAHPEIFAGAGWGGMLFGTKVKEHILDGQPYTAYDLSEDMLKRDEALEMPIALFMGENEMLRLLPVWREPQGEARTGVIPLFPQDKMQAFNNLRRVAGCRPTTFLKEGEACDNEVERRTGIHFERTTIEEHHQRHYYIGYNEKPDGDCLFKTIACEGMVHWPPSMFAEYVWDHIRQFARNPETGKLIRLTQ